MDVSFSNLPVTALNNVVANDLLTLGFGSNYHNLRSKLAIVFARHSK